MRKLLMQSRILSTYLFSVTMLLVMAVQPGQPGAPVTSVSPEPRFEAGIIVNPALSFDPREQDGYYRTVAEDLELPWVSYEMDWKDIETAPGEYHWPVLDLTQPSAQHFGLKTLLTIKGTPDFYRESGLDLSKAVTYSGRQMDGPPENFAHWTAFLRAMLERYPGLINAVEIWRDENLDRGWTSTQGLNAANYVALLREAFTTIKSIDPSILVISGALAPTGLDNGTNAYDDFHYLDLLIAAGMLNYTDCVGVQHNGINMPPYYRFNEGYNDPRSLFRGPFDNPHHSWNFLSTLEGNIALIQKADSDTPLCITSFGWPSSEGIGGHPLGFEFADDNTLQEQAAWTVDALSIMRDSNRVRLAIVDNYNKGPQAGWNKDNDDVPYSLVGPNWHFRPAYEALRNWQMTQP